MTRGLKLPTGAATGTPPSSTSCSRRFDRLMVVVETTLAPSTSRRSSVATYSRSRRPARKRAYTNQGMHSSDVPKPQWIRRSQCAYCSALVAMSMCSSTAGAKGGAQRNSA
jgi:hypothetical protein